MHSESTSANANSEVSSASSRQIGSLFSLVSIADYKLFSEFLLSQLSVRVQGLNIFGGLYWRSFLMKKKTRTESDTVI
jgi:hypothetical protein